MEAKLREEEESEDENKEWKEKKNQRVIWATVVINLKLQPSGKRVATTASANSNNTNNNSNNQSNNRSDNNKNNTEQTRAIFN